MADAVDAADAMDATDAVDAMDTMVASDAMDFTDPADAATSGTTLCSSGPEFGGEAEFGPAPIRRIGSRPPKWAPPRIGAGDTEDLPHIREIGPLAL